MASAVFCRMLRPLTFTHKLVRTSQASYYQGKEGPITKDGVYVVDLRSDTLTQPSQEMRRVMSDAAVGDDVLGEDPTVKGIYRAFGISFFVTFSAILWLTNWWRKPEYLTKNHHLTTSHWQRFFTYLAGADPVFEKGEVQF